MRAGDVNLKLTADIADLQAKMTAAGGGVDAFADRTGAAAREVQAHADRMTAAFDGVRTGAMGAAGGMGSAAQQVQAHAAQIGAAVGQVARQNQISAGQTAMAWRMLPMQLQDFGVSVASGMNPLMAMVQQGPQITGAFGGVRATISAMTAAISPMAAGLGGAAAVLGAVGVAAYKGSREIDALSDSLLNSGNQIGMTAGQLSVMAQRLDGIGGVTRGAATEALALLASKSGITSDGIERITATALRLEAAGGPAVAETAKRFAELAKEPLSASMRLNEQYGYLTESVYRQIKALEEQGRSTEAAKVAQDAFLAAGEGRLPEMERNLGALERGWKSLTGAVSEAWDAMKGVGRAETTEDRLIAAQKRLEDLRARASRGRGMYGAQLAMTKDGLRDVDAVLKQQEAEVQRLQAAKAFDDAMAKQQQRSAQATKALAAWDQQGVQYLTNQAKMAQEVARAREAGAAAGRSQAEIDARVAAIQAKYADKTPKSNVEPFVAQREAAKEWASAIERLQGIQADAEGQATGYGKAQQAVMEVFRSPAFLAAPASWKAVFVATAEAAIAAEQQASAQKRATEVAREANKAHADLIAGLARSAQGALDQADKLQVEEQAAALAARQNVSLAVAIEQVSIARLREKQVEMMGNEDAVLAIQREIDARSRLLDLMRRKDGRAADEKGKEDAARRLEAYLSKDVGPDFAAGFDRASQSLGVFVQQLSGAVELQAEYQQALQDAGGDSAKIAAVQAKNAKAQLTTYAAMAGAAKGFFREGSKGYKAMQSTEKAFRAFEMAMAVESAARQLGLIGSVTAATFTSESLKVGAVAGGQAGQTAAVGAGEAQRNALKIPGVFLSFMSSLGPWGMAAAAAAIAAVWNGSGTHGTSVDMTEQRQAANGTGTVLGDPTAQSESIARSIERLTDVDTMTMRYSAQMLASLRSIEASMAGVSVQILRAGGITTGRNLGIQTGVLATNVGDPILGALGIDDMARNLPVIGRSIGSLQSMWGKTTASIIDAGLTLEATIADLLEGDGLQQYADVRITRSSWFGARKKTRTETQFGDVGDDVTRQFGLVFQGVADSLEAASMAMGADAARVGERLADYVIEIPRLSLEGLTGDDLQEAIAAAVGAQADQMARTVFEGLDDWQLIGEGYYETVVRVASGSEQAQQALRGLGVAVADLADVANKQAQDVAAEIARASLVAAETLRSTSATTSRQVTETARQLVRDGYWETVQTGSEVYNESGDARPTFDRVWHGPVYQDVATTRTVTDTATQRVLTGIGEIISTMSGSASEIADAYRALTDVRESMVLLGLSGDAVTRGLLQGAGSLDALTDGMGAFEAGFTTSQEQASAASARLKADIERLGLAMPSSAQGFAALVRGIDTSTEAGQQLLGSVLMLSDDAAGVFGSISDIDSERADLEQQLLELQGDTAAIRAAELDKLDESNRALQSRIWALQDEKERLDALANAGKGISSLIEELHGGASSSTSLATRRAAYNRELQLAQAGDVSASESIAATARSLIDAIEASATDPLQLALETARIASQLQALPAIAALQQQASEQASAAISAAATSSQAAASASAAAASGAPSTASTAQSSTATELQALRSAVADLTAEVQRLRSGQESGLASIAANTGRSARLLDDLTDDGQSLNVRVKA